MTGCPDPDPVHTAMHELAEGLQAAGNYLSALRHRAEVNGAAAADIETIDRALAQWARAKHAMRELRACLNSPEKNGR